MAIIGTNLAGATAVDFGATQVTSFISDTASQIILSSPTGTGTVDVTVRTAAGLSATSSADRFLYFATQAVPSSIFGGIRWWVHRRDGDAGLHPDREFRPAGRQDCRFRH